MIPIILYKFRYRDPVYNRISTSRFRATRAVIEREFPGAEILEQSAILVDESGREYDADLKTSFGLFPRRNRR